MTQPERQPCGALLRHQHNDPGWTCDGTGLLKILEGPVVMGERVPVVAPEWALEEVLCGAHIGYRPEPFTGGDHLHWVRYTGPDAMVVRYDRA